MGGSAGCEAPASNRQVEDAELCTRTWHLLFALFGMAATASGTIFYFFGQCAPPSGCNRAI